MAHRFTCGEKKIWQNIEKSQNIMKLIVGLKCYIQMKSEVNVQGHGSPLAPVIPYKA